MFERARHQPGHAGEDFQKPSSARPTQLNAKIEQATAATEAQVAIVLAERMIKPFVQSHRTLSDLHCSIMARIHQDK
jgi:hypothetical protein